MNIWYLDIFHRDSNRKFFLLWSSQSPEFQSERFQSDLKKVTSCNIFFLLFFCLRFVFRTLNLRICTQSLIESSLLIREEGISQGNYKAKNAYSKFYLCELRGMVTKGFHELRNSWIRRLANQKANLYSIIFTLL